MNDFLYALYHHQWSWWDWKFRKILKFGDPVPPYLLNFIHSGSLFKIFGGFGVKKWGAFFDFGPDLRVADPSPFNRPLIFVVTLPYYWQHDLKVIFWFLLTANHKKMKRTWFKRSPWWIRKEQHQERKVSEIIKIIITHQYDMLLMKYGINFWEGCEKLSLPSSQGRVSS